MKKSKESISIIEYDREAIAHGRPTFEAMETALNTFMPKKEMKVISTLSDRISIIREFYLEALEVYSGRFERPSLSREQALAAED